jgi:crotonobetainyl-CoA:carnitine CoA-transferase CaiB-like acyl-CoA transferase
MHSISTLIEDDHLADVGFFEKVSHPTEGILRAMAAPETWSETPSSARGHAPNLGEHTVEILLEIGMDLSEIEQGLSEWAFQHP